MRVLWVFDNDGTLYSLVAPIEQAIVRLMKEFIARELNVSVEEADRIRVEWLKKYKTSSTLIAAMYEGINPLDFINASYLAVDFERFIKPNPVLAQRLSMLSGNKVILTNNPKAYALKVAQVLGISSFFDHIYGMEEMGYILKPDPNAFNPIVSIAHGYTRVIFVDDSPVNIATAFSLGYETVLIGNASPIGQTANRILSSIEELSN